MAVPLTRGTVIETFAAMFIMMGFAVTIVFEDVTPVLCALDPRAGVIIDALADTVIDLAPSVGFDVVVAVDANICVATTTVFEFILMLTSSEEAFLFGLGA